MSSLVGKRRRNHGLGPGHRRGLTGGAHVAPRGRDAWVETVEPAMEAIVAPFRNDIAARRMPLGIVGVNIAAARTV